MADRAPRVVVLGSLTCEDTAIARSRLEALGIPYRFVDIDAEPPGLERLLALEGHRVTPVVLVEGEDRGANAHVAEPSVERLDAWLEGAGIRLVRPRATAVHGTLASRSIPFRTLEAPGGPSFSLERLRGRRGAALLLTHPAACLACRGYARGLAAQAEGLLDVDALPVIAVPDRRDAVAAWRADLAPGSQLLADPEGRWGSAVRVALGLPADEPALILLDRFEAPRAISTAPEAGGLIAPPEAVEWLGFVALDCPECGDEVAWPA